MALTSLCLIIAADCFTLQSTTQMGSVKLDSGILTKFTPLQLLLKLQLTWIFSGLNCYSNHQISPDLDQLQSAMNTT